MKHVIFGFIVSLFAVYGQAQGIDTNIHLEDGTIVDCSHINQWHCCSRKRCGGERCRAVRITELNASEPFYEVALILVQVMSKVSVGQFWRQAMQ